jgi:hypothetical protein
MVATTPHLCSSLLGVVHMHQSSPPPPPGGGTQHSHYIMVQGWPCRTGLATQTGLCVRYERAVLQTYAENLHQPFCLSSEQSGSALNIGQHICSVIKCLIMGCSGSTQM